MSEESRYAEGGHIDQFRLSKQRVLFVLSGGLDSAVAAWDYIANWPDDERHAIFFYYGSGHEKAESESATMIAAEILAPLHRKNLAEMPGSELTLDPMEHPEGVALTFVPGRNIVFGAYAANYLYQLGGGMLVMGVHQTDSPYPDCRVSFIKPFMKALFTGTARQVMLRTPLISMSKTAIVRYGSKLGVPFEKTWTCYNPLTSPEGVHIACAECDACLVRIEAFQNNKLTDPIPYAKSVRWVER